MTVSIERLFTRVILSLVYTVSLPGLVIHSSQALAVDYVAATGQLAPNPNQAGDSISINGSVDNAYDYNNFGAIQLASGASLSNSNGLFSNRNGATLTNSGDTLDQNGFPLTYAGTIYNFAALTNTDIGSNLINQTRAALFNGGSFNFPPLGGPLTDNLGPGGASPVVSVVPSATLNNQNGATLTNNSGSILNWATLNNNGVGTNFINRNGDIFNGLNVSFTSETTPAATITNQNGATLTNTGTAYINNVAILINTDSGTTLSNLNSGVLNNGPYYSGSAGSGATLTNQHGATLTNSGVNYVLNPDGSSWSSMSTIQNQAIMTNTDAGSTINNLNGAVLNNGQSSSFNGNSPGVATLTNQHGAALINSGAFITPNPSYSNVITSSLNNYATLVNTDAGSLLSNQNGATLSNGQQPFPFLSTTANAAAALTNQHGASLTNTGYIDLLGVDVYQHLMRSTINNQAILTNTDAGSTLTNLNGAIINNASTGILNNQNAATLINSGAFTHLNGDGTSSVIQTTINNNSGSIVNTDAGSVLLNQDGAILNNTTSGGILIGGGSPLPTATLINQNAATLTNSGAYISLNADGSKSINQTTLNNSQGNIVNSGVGTNLNNLNGAIINNQSGGMFSLFPSTSSTTLTNQQGATLTNSGAYTWVDQNSVSNTTQSTINNQANLINTDVGTTLNNQSGARLWNGSNANLVNQNGAKLVNASGATVQNDGQIQNDAVINNAGAFNSNGSVSGTGQYIQTAGKTVVNGTWTQSLTEIQGGTFTGTGGSGIPGIIYISDPGTIAKNTDLQVNGNLLIDGGTLAPGNPTATTTLTVNGDLAFSSGLIDIKVGSFTNGATLFQVDSFGNQIFTSNSTLLSDLIKVTGKTTFSGGTVEFDFINGYTPKVGDSLSWLTAMAGISGLNTLNYTFTGLAAGEALAFSSDGSNLAWTVTAAPVPLPAAAWLFIGGLLGVTWLGRKKI